MKRKIILKAFAHDAIVHHKLSAMNFTSDFVDAHINLSKMPVMDLNNMEGYADILLVEVEGSGDQVQAMQPVLKKLDQQTSVIVLLRDGNAQMVRQLMRHGVHDVIPLPVDWEELENDIRKLIKSRQDLLQTKSARVVSLMSAKGGAGATTITVNMGYELVARHKAKVCLIDLDLQYGDVAACLDIDNAKNVMDAVNHPERIDPIFLKALITKNTSGLDILASPSDLCDISNISEGTIARIIEAVSEMYDYVLIDLPHVVLPWTAEAIKKSDRCMVVVQRSIGYIRSARVLLDNLSKYGIDSSQIEIINNRDTKKTGQVNHKTIAEMLEKPAFFNVRNNYRMVSDAGESGKPIGKISVGSGISKDIERIAMAVSKNETAIKSDGLLAHVFHQ